jgi:hypothetical protein
MNGDLPVLFAEVVAGTVDDHACGGLDPGQGGDGLIGHEVSSASIHR